MCVGERVRVQLAGRHEFVDTSAVVARSGAMAGTRPLQQPTREPKCVQKQKSSSFEESQEKPLASGFGVRVRLAASLVT